MYPASFEYFAPTTLDEALSILDRHGDDGKVVAGGQSLIPMMKLRFAAPAALVDINRIPGLDILAEDGGVLRIGALVRHAACERSELLRGRYGSSSATPRRRSPTRSSETAARSAARSRTPTRRATGARSCSPRGPRSVARSSGGDAHDRDRRAPRRGRSRRCWSRTRSSPRCACPTRARASSGTYLKLERKVGDYATVGVAVQVTLSNGIDRAGRDRAHRRGADEHRARRQPRRRSPAPSSTDDGDRRRRRGSRPRPPSRTTTSAAQPSTSETSFAIFTERGLRTAVDAARAA